MTLLSVYKLEFYLQIMPVVRNVKCLWKTFLANKIQTDKHLRLIFQYFRVSVQI